MFRKLMGIHNINHKHLFSLDVNKWFNTEDVFEQQIQKFFRI